MVRFLLICNAVPANVTIMSALKVMVSPLAASLMAWRSVPAPLLALLVTVKVAVPDSLSDEAKAALKEYAEKAPQGNPRDALFGG